MKKMLVFFGTFMLLANILCAHNRHGSNRDQDNEKPNMYERNRERIEDERQERFQEQFAPHQQGYDPQWEGPPNYYYPQGPFEYENR